jgi:hypothetical protein
MLCPKLKSFWSTTEPYFRGENVRRNEVSGMGATRRGYCIIPWLHLIRPADYHIMGLH